MLSAPGIAVVDDDLSVRRSVQRLLRSAGYEAEAYPSAQELIDSDFVSGASCFILDIHLQRSSGFELLERLRSLGNRAPAIFVTAFDDDATRERARSLGAASYLRKPFDGNALLDAIAEALQAPSGTRARS